MTTGTKIVIVSGQDFSVPVETDNEAIRQQLVSMGFADVASASIKKGTREVNGETVETVEFEKRAGTKGLDGNDLVQVLQALPEVALPRRSVRLPQAARAIIRRLRRGEITLAELADSADIQLVLDRATMYRPALSEEGRRLCERIRDIPAAAAPSSPLGW